MKRTIISSALIMVLLSLSIQVFSQEITGLNKAEQVYEQLNNLEPLKSKTADVSNYTFFKDSAEAVLKNGKIYFLTEVGERIIAALFIGEGSFSTTPPTEIERERVYSEFKTRELNVNFDQLFIFATDNTLADMINTLDIKDDPECPSFSKEIYNAKKYFSDVNTKSYAPQFFGAVLNESDFFYLHLNPEKTNDKPIFYIFDSLSREEVVIGVKDLKYSQISIVCSYHKIEDYFAISDFSKEAQDMVQIDKYSIEVNIDNRLNFSARCQIDLQLKMGKSSWIPFYINDRMKIESIKSENEEPLNFFKSKSDSFIWIEVPDEYLAEGKEIIVNYAGDLILQGGSVVTLREHNHWYPVYNTYVRRNYDITFNHPVSYTMVTVGQKVSETEDKVTKIRTSRWVPDYPVNNAPINMGKFKTEVFKDRRIPVLSLNLSKNIPNSKADVANSISFYQNTFGKSVYEPLTVAEIPRFLAGEAYPGLINFYTDEFITNPYYNVQWDIIVSDKDFSQLRAHEVAHQWWGCAVAYHDYHDVWLSEGLAEFSSIWFLQFSSKNKKEYFDYLKQWKHSISETYKGYKRENKTAPPIWLGTRTPASIYYKKSAWIFHMLRNFMMNIETFDDSAFTEMLKDYYETYKNSYATTEDFKLIVEKHTNSSMTWFFDQWVYGNEIPKFDFSYKITLNDEGNYVANIEIKQQEVSDEFISYIPIEIDFGNNQKYYFRAKVKGAGTKFDVNLPYKAKYITFNVFDSVLSKD
ncbi:MAG: M1 family aminopeptidase [Candidatus Cloacimonetes bacterium]|nr:M1 family aminopeptidase [Candidatus Cloacimonadota bacterium]